MKAVLLLFRVFSLKNAMTIAAFCGTFYNIEQKEIWQEIIYSSGIGTSYG